MHIIYYRKRMYHVEENGDIHCLYEHPRSKGWAPTWRKVNPTGHTAWHVRKLMKKEKHRG